MNFRYSDILQIYNYAIMQFRDYDIMQKAYYYNFRSWFLNDSVRRPYLPRMAFFLSLTYNLPSDGLRRDTGDFWPKLPLYTKKTLHYERAKNGVFQIELRMNFERFPNLTENEPREKSKF